MRVSLTVHDDNGSLEITSVGCDSFLMGCHLMKTALGTALYEASINMPTSSAKYPKPVSDVLFAIERMGGLEYLPVVISC